MNIGIAGFGHETITFWPGVTGLASFERVAMYGKDVIEKSRGTNAPIGGFIDVLEAEGAAMTPICAAIRCLAKGQRNAPPVDMPQ